MAVRMLPRQKYWVATATGSSPMPSGRTLRRQYDTLLWGDEDQRDQIVDYAWCSLNSGRHPHLLAAKPNPFGLFDVIGNVCDGTTTHVASKDQAGALREPYPDHPVTDLRHSSRPESRHEAATGVYMAASGLVHSTDHRAGQGRGVERQLNSFITNMVDPKSNG